MGHIELSAELHAVEHSPASVALTDSASHPEPALSEMAERQHSSTHCSTSSSASALQPDTRHRPRASSVRSRAAMFEAMISSPPVSSPFNTSATTSSPLTSPTRPKPSGLTRSISSAAHDFKAASNSAVGQELEMVDQGAQACPEDAKPNSPAESMERSMLPLPALTTPMFANSIQRESVCEIQPQCSSCADAVIASQAEQGIELQEGGHAEMLEHALGRLQADIEERDKQNAAAASALACKTQECESLMRVVRELTESRSKLVCARTNLAEKLAEMQHEYMRLMRVADLSRVVSKENVAKTAKVMKTLKQVEDESARQQHLIGYFKERNKNLKDENLELRERVCLLERLDLLTYSRDSVCMREFKLHALKETY